MASLPSSVYLLIFLFYTSDVCVEYTLLVILETLLYIVFVLTVGKACILRTFRIVLLFEIPCSRSRISKLGLSSLAIFRIATLQ